MPTDVVKFDSQNRGSRQYRGGEIHVMEGSASGFVQRVASVTYLGMRCLKTQGGSDDEPYFILGVDFGDGSPVVQLAKYENITQGSEGGDVRFLVGNQAPNPMAIRAIAYENDAGDPEQTKKNVQDELVKLSNEAVAVYGAVEAADSPDLATVFAAGSNALKGAWSAVIAAIIVGAFGMEDDYTGQDSRVLFLPPEPAMTPATIGTFHGQPYNVKLDVDGKDEGHYELFFRVNVADPPAPQPVGPG
jgi:hypothetical protein